MDRAPLTHHEPHDTSQNRLNRLRATVLGANDGIVSTAGLVLGVTGAAASKESVLVAGFAGAVAGALSMAAGEFVSVSSQRDSQKSAVTREKQEIKQFPQEELEELVRIYEDKGLSRSTAELVAKELTEKDALNAHLDAEFGIDRTDLNNPWQAAAASAGAFVLGATIPLAAIAFSSDELRPWITGGAVVIALAVTGTLSALAGRASKPRAALRVVSWGIGAMVITYAIGYLLGINIAH